MTFKIEEAENTACKLVEILKPYCLKVEIAGSIRRRKKEVHDIDIVCIPKPFSHGAIKTELKKTTKISRCGDKIISGFYGKIPFDIYFAIPQSFETLLLIRTGSKKHNIMLCRKAKEKGCKLYASGLGLYKNGELIANDEKTILKTLLGRYVKPEERD